MRELGGRKKVEILRTGETGGEDVCVRKREREKIDEGKKSLLSDEISQMSTCLFLY